MSSDNTTEFIRRRIRHWKTTLAGIGGMLCPIAAIIWPHYADKILSISCLLSGWGLTLAADASKVQK
jgi:hypothetical protein